MTYQSMLLNFTVVVVFTRLAYGAPLPYKIPGLDETGGSALAVTVPAIENSENSIANVRTMEMIFDVLLVSFYCFTPI